jgi:sarcosine oxidase
VPTNFDIIIAGLGAMGSAAAFHLARRGQRVLGFDRFTPPHSLGSSHGQTRIIREAYFEHPIYVPMVQRAYVLWDELARAAGVELLKPTGGLMIGRPDSVVFRGAKDSADAHRLPYEILTAAQVRRRFPALRPDDDMLAVLEPRAGILFPERCIAAHLTLAARHGATLRYDEPILHWSADDDGVKVLTRKNEFRARQLILTAGSWINYLIAGRRLPFTIERQVLFWFEAQHSPAEFYPERLPIHLWQFDGKHFFYGFPDLGDGVKVARHHDGELTSPEVVRRDVTSAEVDEMRAIVRRYLPAADGPLRSATVCLYTNTPDEHFWIDRLPDCPQVLVASPCSGHGFKFSSVIGEVLADLVMQVEPRFDLTLFRARPVAVAHREVARESRE